MANLQDLTVEHIHDYTRNVLFPDAHQIWCTEQIPGTDLSFNGFLKDNGLSKFSPMTTWRWMRRLGMKYECHRKSFYVDGHERNDVVDARVKFCNRYLLEYEPRCFRWVHLSEEECLTVPKLDVDLGAKFTALDGTVKYEFHEDYLNFLYKDRNEEQPFQIGMSIRAPANSSRLEIVGQDEWEKETRWNNRRIEVTAGDCWILYRLQK